jgi:desampylase
MWVMGLKLSRQQRQLLLDWATEAGDTECCGLLLGENDVVERLELTNNVADNPETNFEIDPSALILAEKGARQGGIKILGYFHSHPSGNAQPSKTDERMAAADGRRWLIIAGGKILCWRSNREAPRESVSFDQEDIVWG